VPCLPVIVDRDDRKDPGRGELLALHEMRRHLERVAAADPSTRRVLAMM
jgi:hypothetical protein